MAFLVNQPINSRARTLFLYDILVDMDGWVFPKDVGTARKDINCHSTACRFPLLDELGPGLRFSDDCERLSTCGWEAQGLRCNLQKVRK